MRAIRDLIARRRGRPLTAFEREKVPIDALAAEVGLPLDELVEEARTSLEAAERGSAELLPGIRLEPEMTVVDVGFGRGDLLARAAELGASVVGIDSQQAHVDDLRERLREQNIDSFVALCAEAPPIPLADESAEVVLCLEVLEHVGGPAGELVGELARIAKRGGLVYLTVPDPLSERVLLELAPPDYSQPPGHIRTFERGELVALVEAAGLEVIARRGVGFYDSLWWALRMALASDYLPGDLPPAPALLATWERLWRELERAPQGAKAIAALDAALPKSQVVLARKP
jgi:SAM-dependent methyltransferase